MSREEQIRKAAYSGKNNLHAQPHPVPGVAEMVNEYFAMCFKAGAQWADSHPQWYDAQGDNVPKYGREVIVIRRNGMICFGHRPNPKGYVVDGKKCFAKTYDKNDWNIPDIALWLDVDIPDELIEQITDKWFEENEQRTTNSQ